MEDVRALSGPNTGPRGNAPRERDHGGRDHPVPFRTRQLSLPSPKVLRVQPVGGQDVALAEGVSAPRGPRIRAIRGPFACRGPFPGGGGPLARFGGLEGDDPRPEGARDAAVGSRSGFGTGCLGGRADRALFFATDYAAVVIYAALGEKSAFVQCDEILDDFRRRDVFACGYFRDVGCVPPYKPVVFARQTISALLKSPPHKKCHSQEKA